MKRWMLFILVGIVSMSVALFALHQYLTIFPATPVPQSGIVRTPRSAFKYQLCTEAYAFAHATPDNPYKTDYSFRDPFRKGDDTITPRLLDYDPKTQSVNFSIDIIINNVATFHTIISPVHEQDGISVLIPDLQNHLQSSSVPQLIITSFGKGRIAVLDYTCPDQWVWKPKK
jgi:hypothetical protein